MRMLEIFSSEKTYLPVIPDANYVASLLEQILHYMVQKGMFTVGVTGLLCIYSRFWMRKHWYYLSGVTLIDQHWCDVHDRDWEYA